MEEPIPHPRESFDLIGCEEAEAAFALALARGRLHHAWLLSGPPGVGKASFAYRAARRLLGAAPDPVRGGLASAAGDHVCRLIALRAHPDLFVVQRQGEEGKARRDIPVEEVREIGEFLAKTPSQGGRRIAIIDDADFLNAHGVNALLKAVEEPPVGSVLFLVAASPGALGATLVSRCAKLRFAPPRESEARAWLTERASLDEETAARLLALASGAPGRALALAREGGLQMDEAARQVLSALPERDEGRLLELADQFRGAAGQGRFRLFLERLAAAVRASALEEAAAGERPRRAADLAGAASMITALAEEAEAINLDREAVLFTAVSQLETIARARERC
ncbi:MAG: DNA polymerase III subunit delta' [Caulobacteraceae bacterium]